MTTGCVPGVPGGVFIVMTFAVTLPTDAEAPPIVTVVPVAKPVPCTMNNAPPAAGPLPSTVPVTVGCGLSGDVTPWKSRLTTASCEPQASPAGNGNTICVADALVTAVGTLFTSSTQPGRKLVPVTVIGCPDAALSGTTLVIVGGAPMATSTSIAFVTPRPSGLSDDSVTACSVKSSGNVIRPAGSAIVNGDGAAGSSAGNRPNVSASTSSVGPHGSTGKHVSPKPSCVPSAPGCGSRDTNSTYGAPGPNAGGELMPMLMGWCVARRTVRRTPPVAPSTVSVSAPNEPA